MESTKVVGVVLDSKISRVQHDVNCQIIKRKGVEEKYAEV